jgi:YVTN family beta-propeller protein
VVGTVPTGDASRGIAVNPQGTRVFVTNVHDGSVTVLDAHTLAVLAQFQTGHKPWSVIFNRDGSLAIVSNTGSDDITVINATTLRVVKTVAAGDGPFFAVFNEDETKLYVSNAGPIHPPFVPSVLTIIDTATWTVIGSTTLQIQPFDLVFVNPI